jgi:hypothetical protein
MTTSFFCFLALHLQTTRCFFALAALVAIIGAQQSAPVAPTPPAAPFDDLAVAEQDFVNPLSRNLALGGGLFDQIAADAGGNFQRGAILLISFNSNISSFYSVRNICIFAPLKYVNLSSITIHHIIEKYRKKLMHVIKQTLQQ